MKIEVATIVQKWIARLPLKKRAFAEAFKEDLVEHFSQEKTEDYASEEELLDSWTLTYMAQEVLCLNADSTPTIADQDWRKLVEDAEDFCGERLIDCAREAGI